MRNVIKALGKGVLKIMSKMGISTISSYAGAQAFEAVGLSQEFIDEYFTGTTSKLGGVGIDVIATENLHRHRVAYPEDAAVRAHERLTTGGEYQWRRDGSPHLFNPETVFRLQHSTRNRRYDVFREYTSLVDSQAEELMTLRGMFALRTGTRPPVPIDEVESVESIVKRFSTGAMSYGSISKEAHESLAIAMNRIGAKSNTGEGGEDLDRLLDPERRSAIKQVASGRFGVTSMYLTHADRPPDQARAGRQARRGRPAAARRRCTRGSRAPGTRPRASASSRRRRTTTSTRSRTSSSSSSTSSARTRRRACT